jgi:tetraacyldisaccharide-1-P 4'-kinase
VQSQFRERSADQVGRIEHLSASLKPIEMGMPWAKGRYLAFAGIGDPEKFFCNTARIRCAIGAHRRAG